MVKVEFCYFGQKTVKNDMSETELRELLAMTVGCVETDINDCCGTTLSGLTLKLSDGRYVSLYNDYQMMWGDTESWIGVSVYDEERWQEHLEWKRQQELKYRV